MVHDRSPIGQKPLPGAYMVRDRFVAHVGQRIHNGAVCRWTGALAESDQQFELEESRVLGEPVLGVSLWLMKAVGNRAAGDVDYLNRNMPLITHGPALVMNGGTAAIFPWEEVTAAAPATDTAGATWLGLVTNRTLFAQSKLGVAMDYFAPFDNPGDIAAIWVDPGYTRTI